jgi:hypothetical protein
MKDSAAVSQDQEIAVEKAKIGSDEECLGGRTREWEVLRV